LPGYYKIVNWDRFQHYTKRNPPWIKLHYEILSSADWVELSDASRVLAVACMLIASRNEGIVPSNKEYIKRVAYLNKTPDFQPLLKCGFLQGYEGMQADASTMQADATSESDSETDSNTEADATTEPNFAAKDNTCSQILEALNTKFGLQRTQTKALRHAVGLCFKEGYSVENIVMVAKHRLTEDWFKPRAFGAESLIRLKSFESALERAKEDGESDGIFTY